jgi:hypothetical protein
MADKLLFVRIAIILNYLCALALLVSVIMRFVDFGQSNDVFFYLLTFYLIGFAALLVVAELRVRSVIVYCEFLKGRPGKGMYLLLIGTLLFDESRSEDIIISILLVLVGLFNIIVSCMRGNKPKGKNTKGKKREEPILEEYEEDN